MTARPLSKLASLAVVLVVVGASAVSASARTQQPSNPEVAGRAEAVVEDMAAGRFEDVYEQFDQKMRAGLPVAKIAAAWNAVRQAAGAFERVVSTSTREQNGYDIAIVSCAFELSNVDVQVVFNAGGEIAGFAMRPGEPRAMAGVPAYAKPGSYTEAEVAVGEGEWAVPGTLTMPVGDGQFPAVVLVQGSGPLDRDATVGATKSSRDLALGLASRGVVVLRYDKRSQVHGQRMVGLAGLTVDDAVIDDARAAIALLEETPRVDGERIFVLGHSLGGTLAPRIAAGESLAGLIVLAGATRSIEELIVEQTRHVLSADGPLTAEERDQVAEVEALAARILSLDEEDRESAEPIFGAPAAYWLDLRGYEPAAAAAELDLPMLILQGERDYQVTMVDFAGWRSALAGRESVTLKSYPALNHLFVAGTGTSLPTEYLTPANVDVQVVDDIAAWIRAAPSTP